MSNYTKTTNFATKDSLASGNPNKIVKGAEINSEFDNIATAVATKADTASPSLTGTVTAAALNVTGNLDVGGTLEFDSISGTGSVAVTDIADEDNMSSNSATKLATQQSIKAYVDSQVTAQDLDLTDGSSSISIDLDSEALSVLGGTGIDSTASGNGVTLAIDSTVTTLTGSQTLTNKTLTSPDVNTPDIDGGTIDGTVIGGSSAAAGSFTTVGATGNITVGGTVDGRDVATDGIKLDGIEASATADQTNAEIRTAVEAASDSNVFTDADHSKLNAIETSADVTDTANVTSAGALMDSELTDIASVKALNQGVATTDSPTFAAVTVNGNVEFDGLSGTGSVTVTDILDQDDMSGNSATALATQQSIKAYVDAQQDTVDTLAEILALSNATGGSNIVFGDSSGATDDRLQFGASQDLSIYHNANNSFIQDTGTGSLFIDGSATVTIRETSTNENMAVFTGGGSASLYHNGNLKLATASGGISVTGEVAATSLDISGDIDVDGTTNLDVVDIDGAVDMASTLGVTGVITANAGVVVDNITIDGNEIDVGSGNLTLDVAGNIILDSDVGQVVLADGGSNKGLLKLNGNNLEIKSEISDADIKFNGNDGGSAITALTLDMSNAGAATFNNHIKTQTLLQSIGADTQTNSTASQNIGIHLQNTSNTDGNFVPIDFYNSTGFVTGRIGAEFQDAGDRNTDLYFATRANGGGLTERLRVLANGDIYFLDNGATSFHYDASVGLTINEAGDDRDFRVESNGNDHMLFVDGGNDAVGIGTSSPADILSTSFSNNDGGKVGLQIHNTNIGTTANFAGIYTTAVNGAIGMRVQAASLSGVSAVTFGSTTSHPVRFVTADVERFRIASDGSLSTPTLGTSNVRFGVNAGNSIASGGNQNTVIGDEAGTAITTGDDNVAVGFTALDALDTGQYNIAIGVGALSADTKGNRSVGVGLFSLNEQNFTSSTDAYNVAMGFYAGRKITTGVQNTLIGGLAGDALQDADDNTVLGFAALSNDTLGSKSTAVGRGALQAQNFSSATDSYNTAMGYFAGASVTTGVQNTLIGGLAGDGLTTADGNTALGYNSLGSTCTGNYNQAFGVGALSANTSGAGNIGIGLNALFSNTGSSLNVAIGAGALDAFNVGSGSGYNVAVGDQAGGAVTTGINNTLIGGLAGDALTDADYNVAVGFSALTANQLGGYNTAIGAQALANCNPASATLMYNTAVGLNAGVSVTTGTNNTFVGGLAGDGTDDGGSNVAVGMSALSANCGSSNTAVGVSALTSSTGSTNTAFGFQAGANATSANNNVFLGRDSGITGSPGGNVTTAGGILCVGDENIGAAHVQVDWTVASDARDKTDFTALDLGLEFVKDLQPVTYKWDKRSKYGDKSADGYDLNAQTPDGTHKENWLDIGFKAQEVEALEIAAGYNKDNNTNLVSSHTEDGKQMGLQYSKFVPILVKAIQEQQALIESLTARIETLEG